MTETPVSRAVLLLVPLLAEAQHILRRSQNHVSDRADEKIGEAFDRVIEVADVVSSTMTRLKGWANFPDAGDMEVRIDDALAELRAIENGG